MKILIVAGGSGGHLFPAVRLAEEVRSRQVGEVLFVTSSRKEDRDILSDKNIKFATVPVIGFRSKNILHIINFTLCLIAGTVKSVVLILRFRPSVVIGFGGYVSGPVVLLAALFRIKTIIHEQNVYPGKTNRILARSVDKIAVSFPETREYLKKFESKLILSGNPLRKELKTVEKTSEIFTILAMGGSQGAHILNRLMPEAVGLMQEERREALEIIHISGYRDKQEVAKAYEEQDIKNLVVSFTDEMHKFYNASDFVVSRSGATTVSELLHLRKPSILIPYPHRDGHQRLNAKVLEDKGVAIVCEEEALSAEKLRDLIEKFMDREMLREMSQRVQNGDSIDACEILVREIVGVESRE